MAGFLKSGGFSVTVEGLARAARIPGLLEAQQRLFVSETSRALARSVGAKAPGGSSGRVGRSWRGAGLSDREGVIFSAHPGAKALDVGAYIVPKGMRRRSLAEIRRLRRFIRFRVEGREVFVPGVRLKPSNYVRRGLRFRRKIVLEQFQRFFGRLPR